MCRPCAAAARKNNARFRTLAHAVLTSQKIGGAFAVELPQALEKLSTFDIVVGSLAESSRVSQRGTRRPRP